MTIEIDHPELAALHRLWTECTSDGRLPDRTAFTPETLRPWLGHIGIVEVQRDPVRLRIRLAGMHLVEHDGNDHTGRYLHDVLPPPERDAFLGAYLRCLEHLAPQYETLYSRPDINKRFLMRRLLLPVSMDGRRIEQIIAGVYTAPVGPNFRQ